MATIHPDDVLLFHGANPRTGKLSPFELADYERHQRLHKADKPNTIAEFTYPPLDQELSEWLPAIADLPHPSEFANLKKSSHHPTNRKAGFFNRLRAKMGCRRKKKSRGEGGWLASACRGQVVNSVDNDFEPQPGAPYKPHSQSTSVNASRAAAHIHSRSR